ncbi:MAG TPA: phage portal protein [Rhodanobacteraceae bacterium]|nr:phage portal protein [Rhodanobacteraceae bacterium]
MAQSQAYQYPTPAMLAGYRAAVNAPGPDDLRTLGTPIETSSLAAPEVAGPRESFGERLGRALAIRILGADAGRVLFPPQQPLQPIAQPVDMGAVGRPWDYPVGWNTRVTPRTGKVPFRTLREMAAPETGYDVLRLLIERVKDKLLAQSWNVVPRDKETKPDSRCAELEDFFRYPDQVNTFNDWARMLLEQVLVYDAPAVWLRPTRGGDLYALDIIDGSLISPKIMADGRLPTPEYGPAFQQVIKGLPAVDYVQPVPKGQPIPLDPNGQPYPELLYKPRNPRVDSLYGYGPVEQIMTTIYIAHAREKYFLEYYKNGSAPDLLIGVPETWQPTHIEQFQRTWDAMLQGNLANRRTTRFIPGNMKPFDVRERVLTDEADQWLIRICCFAFGLNPMPFIKQMNRGQEQTHHEEAIQEGLEPWQKWFTDFMDRVIALKFGWRDLTFAWREDDPVDPVDQAKIDASDVANAIYHPDEVRRKRGDEPMDPALRDQLAYVNYRAALGTIVPPELQPEQPEPEPAMAGNKPAPEVAGKLGKGARARSSRSTRSVVRY